MSDIEPSFKLVHVQRNWNEGKENEFLFSGQVETGGGTYSFLIPLTAEEQSDSDNLAGKVFQRVRQSLKHSL